MKSSLIKSIVVCIIASCIGLTSCNLKADVDLTDIDVTTSVNTSLAIPLGTMSFKFGDFIGSNTIPQITIDDQGRYVFLDSLEASNLFHPVDPSTFVTRTNSRWNVTENLNQIFDQLQAQHPEIIQALKFAIPGFTGDFSSLPLPFTLPIEYISGGTFEFDIEIPVGIDLSALNLDFNYQRVDSVIVNAAHFTSKFTMENFDLEPNDIQDIEIHWGNNFRNMEPITKLSIEKFGQDIPINLNDFNLVLMKDPSLGSSAENIVDSINMKIRFKIKVDHNITFDNEQYIGYEFGIDRLDFNAMFGYFAAHDLMQDEMKETPLTSLWAGWEMFENWVLPISEPSIRLDIDHTLGVPILVDLKHLYVTSKDGDNRYATFDAAKQQKYKQIHLGTQIAMDDPLDKRAHETIRLDYTDEWGNIDNLFTIPAHAISYAFAVGTDPTSDMQQYRITNNTEVNLKATIQIPFAFNEGVRLTYSDTISNVNISEFDLDSLLASIPLLEDSIEAKLNLCLVVENGIPFKVEGKFTFFDANGNIVKLNAMNDTVTTLTLDYPTTIVNGVVTEPSINNIEIPLELYKEDFKTISTIKSIAFEAMLGDNMHAVNLTPEATVTIKMGVAADVKAIIDLSELF